MTEIYTPLTAQKGLDVVDPKSPNFNNIQIAMYDLYRGSVQQGGGASLKGRTFRNCVLQGPAVLMVLQGTRFERVSFGAPGHISEILFSPVSGTKAIGAIPLEDCVFEDCRFLACGFTGSQTFLDLMVRELGPQAGASGNA